MKTKDYIYCFVAGLFIFVFLNHEHVKLEYRVNELEQYKVDSTHFSAEMRETTMNCIPVTISGAGSPDLRVDGNLKFDVAVCENGLGQAVIYDSYGHFVDDMIAENDEWRQ